MSSKKGNSVRKCYFKGKRLFLILLMNSFHNSHFNEMSDGNILLKRLLCDLGAAIQLFFFFPATESHGNNLIHLNVTIQEMYKDEVLHD